MFTVSSYKLNRFKIRIIFECARGMPYKSALHCAALSSLHTGRTDQARYFFQSIMQPVLSSCIHALLPPLRNPRLVCRLGHAQSWPQVTELRTTGKAVVGINRRQMYSVMPSNFRYGCIVLPMFLLLYFSTPVFVFTLL